MAVKLWRNCGNFSVQTSKWWLSGGKWCREDACVTPKGKFSSVLINQQISKNSVRSWSSEVKF